VTQLAVYEGREVYAFTRPADLEAQEFARALGACWSGSSTEPAPAPLDAAIIFAPVGSLVPLALRAVRKRGVVVCGGIHMSDIPQFPYELLWGEREICSVANLTRDDADKFMSIAPKVPVRTHVECFSLADANEALDRLRHGRLRGAAVLDIG
jgi:propanol-preferring alcohol dehydrogenase